MVILTRSKPLQYLNSGASIPDEEVKSKIDVIQTLLESYKLTGNTQILMSAVDTVIGLAELVRVKK